MKTSNRIALSLMVAFAFIGINAPCSAFQSTSTDDESAIVGNNQTKFLRLETDEFGNPLALQTATTRYALVDDNGEEKLEVILESVVHIGDPGYFRGFQQRFERYDAVLYESMMKQEEKPSGETESPSGFKLLQQLSSGTIGLAYQFDEVNYEFDNMMRADLSPQEIAERMKDRGEDSTTMFSDLLTHLIRKFRAAREGEEVPDSPGESLASKPDGIGFDLSVFTDPDGIMKIRRMMASVLVDSGLLESRFSPGIHNMIIGDRNDHVMSLLNAEIKKGKRHFAIFYGVGHMADFERRLTSEYGMKKVSTNWRNAWDLRDGAIEGAPLEGLVESAFRDSVKDKLIQFAKGVGKEKEGIVEKIPATDNPEDENSQAENTQSSRDKEIEEMTATLKALEAKLAELEKQAKKKRDKEPEEDK